MLAYLDEIPRLQAGQQLMAAEVALYPHLTKASARDWRRAKLAAAMRPVRRGSGRAPGLSLNGQPITMPALKQQLALAFGGAFSAD